MNAATAQAARIADRLTLRLRVCNVTKELYGYAEPVLDDAAMARAFAAYWTKAHGVHTLTAEVVDTAKATFDYRFANR